MSDTPEQFSHLLQVQDRDTTIDQLVHKRANLPERTEMRTIESELSSIGARRAEVAVVRDELGGRQSTIEDHINSSRSRRAELEKRMYSGSVTAPRDLQAMDEEVKHLGQHVSELEDQEIEIMEELEPLDAALGEIDSEIARRVARTEVLKDLIAEEEAEIGAELERERKERAGVATEVPSDLLVRYEQLRKRLGGTGAARVVQGRCGGCHLQLPAMELDKMRKSDPGTIHYCEQCGRILVR